MSNLLKTWIGQRDFFETKTRDLYVGFNHWAVSERISRWRLGVVASGSRLNVSSAEREEENKKPPVQYSDT